MTAGGVQTDLDQFEEPTAEPDAPGPGGAGTTPQGGTPGQTPQT